MQLYLESRNKQVIKTMKKSQRCQLRINWLKSVKYRWKNKYIINKAEMRHLQSLKLEKMTIFLSQWKGLMNYKVKILII